MRKMLAMVLVLVVGAVGLAGCGSEKPPEPVEGIVLEAGDGSVANLVKAAWDPAEDAEGYVAEIWPAAIESEAAAEDGGEGTEHGPLAAENTGEAEAVFTGLSYGKAYTVKVSAYTLDRKGNQVFSDSVSAETITSPAEVKGLSLTASGDGEEPSIKVSWKTAEGAEGYTLEIEPAGDAPGPVEVTGTEYTFKGLEYATEYRISARAFLRYGGDIVTSADAAAADAVTGVPAIESPTPEARGISITEIKLTWEPAEKATGYVIRLGGAQEEVDKIIYEAGEEETEYIVSELRAGAIMYFTVAAKYGDHEYPESETVRGTTYMPAPIKPELPKPDFSKLPGMNYPGLYLWGRFWD